MDPAMTEVRAEVFGRITTAPELARTAEGVAICRFTVATQVGPASNPVVKSIYVVGDPALKPGDDLPVRVKRGLGVGDLVRVPGIERQRIRRRRGVEFCESAIEAREVRLRERGSRSEGAS